MDVGTVEGYERRLAEYGLALQPLGLLPSLETGAPLLGRMRHADLGDLGQIGVLASSAMTLASIAPFEEQGEGATPLLVLGPQINARSSEALRSARINYLDVAGNAFVNLGGVLIDVRGRRVAAPADRVLPNKRSNLFSTKRAQVIFALISWPHLIEAPMRTIAHHANVSVGLAQEALELLRQAGHLDSWPGGSSLRRLPDLIDRWASAYPLGLGSPVRTRTFHGETRRPVELVKGSTVYVSGEAAVDDLNSTTMTLYVHEWTPQIVRLNKWRSDRDPNILVRQAFWSDPSRSTPDGLIHKAPPLLIYADLLAADEGRQREAAKVLREMNPHLRAS